MSKTGKKYQKYSAEFKLCVIMDMREHHLGLLETVMKYWDALVLAEERKNGKRR